MHFLNTFFFDIYPYIAGSVFLIGSWLRYDYGQYTWRAASSQMLDRKGMNLASNVEADRRTDRPTAAQKRFSAQRHGVKDGYQRSA